MTLRAYIYVRYSDPKQERGASRDRQLEDCRRLCESMDWDVEGYVEDLGRSAWKGVHLASGNLGKFVAKVRSGEIPAHGTVLVAEKLDRFSRQGHKTALRWLQDLCELGLTFATVDGARVYTDKSLSENLLPVIEVLMGAKLAQDESDKKSQRVRDALRRKEKAAREHGTVITAKCPGWLVPNADRSGFDIREDRKALVVEMYEMAADGNGPGRISAMLNEREKPAWSKPTEKNPNPTWQLSTVRLILTNPAVEGDYVPGFSNTDKETRSKEPPVMGYYPRIVDADLVARARANLASRKLAKVRNPGGRYAPNVANLFAGMVRCAACGHRMHLRTNGEKPFVRRWQCLHATRKRGCDQTRMFRYAEFERAALNEVLHLALDDRFFAAPDQAGALATKLAELDKTIRDKRGEVARLIRSLAQFADMAEIERQIRVELAALNGAIGELETRREATAEALQKARGAVSPAEHVRRVREVRGALDDADPVTRQAARAKVLQAMRDLNCRVVCEASGGQRLIHLGVGLEMVCSFDDRGNLITRRDDVGDIADAMPGRTPEEVTARVGELIAAMGDPTFAASDDAARMTRFIRRRGNAHRTGASDAS